MVRLWVGDSPLESFRFPSLSASDAMLKVVNRAVAKVIQHQAELNPAEQKVDGEGQTKEGREMDVSAGDFDARRRR